MKTLLAALVALTFATPALAGFGGEAGNAGSSAHAAPVFKPRLVEPPTLTGTPRVGETLTATDGTWSRQPTQFERVWLRCTPSCEPIHGANGATYAATIQDKNARIAVRVVAGNAGGSSTGESHLSQPIDDERLLDAPRNMSPPSVSGTPAVDELLFGDPGEWTDDPVFTYQWFRCKPSCAPVGGATERTFRPTGADAGATIRLSVTAKAGGRADSTASATTAPVARNSFTQILCANPSTGKGVIADSVLPEGMTSTYDRWEFGTVAARSRCGGTMSTSRGIPLRPVSRIWSTGWPQDGAVLRYRAPSGLQFRTARLYRKLALTGSLNMAAGLNTADSDGMYATPSLERCEQVRGCNGIAAANTSPWTSWITFASSSEINGFNMFLRCGAPDTTWVCGVDVDHGYSLYGGSLGLTDVSEPRLTSPPTGSLVSDERIGASASVGVSATDAGSGLYRVRVRVDGASVATQAIDSNQGRCVDVDPTSGNAYEFAFATPCAKSATSTITFDTASWPRGARSLEVVLEDAGRNTVELTRRDVTIGGA